MQRLPEECRARNEIAITFDDGPDPVLTPAVLQMLKARQIRATFFCIGKRCEQHPELVRRIVAEGHALGNHSYSHGVNFSVLRLRSMQQEIERTQRCLQMHTGVRPRFFRAPAGLRNVFLDLALHRAGLYLVSWTRRGFDTRERNPDKVLARLTEQLAAGDILLLHDAGCALTQTGQPVVLEVLPKLLDAVQARGLTPVTLTQAITQVPANG